MEFPHQVTSFVKSHNGHFDRQLILRSGVTVLLGPNGSGKTHILRGLRHGLRSLLPGKIVRYVSAGRIGQLELYRSNYDGQRGEDPNYDDAQFGAKKQQANRHKSETLQGDFQTLSKRPDILIKVQERLQKLFRRQILMEWDGGALKVFFNRLSSDTQPYSAAREASGLVQLVGVLAALYDDEVSAVLIDEPEVSLHPQLQAFLLGEIRHVAGNPDLEAKKLVVLATHSPYMLHIESIDDLCSLAFIEDLNSDPLQLNPELDVLKSRKLRSLMARLGQDHKAAFFAQRPLLVEGPSDVVICRAVAHKTGTYLEAAGSHLLPVVGKGELPTVAKLFRAIGKHPVVLADADAFTDEFDLVNLFVSGSERADQLAQNLGAENGPALASGIYGDYCHLVDEHWSDLAVQIEAHSCWINRDNGNDQKARRRAAFSVLCTMSATKISELTQADQWAGMKRRLTKLLQVLEQLGCFILREGQSRVTIRSQTP